MIKCEQLGQFETSGTTADILAEYAYITNALTEINISRNDVLKAFAAGFYKQEVVGSGMRWDVCWDMMDEYIDEMLADTNPHD